MTARSAWERIPFDASDARDPSLDVIEEDEARLQAEIDRHCAGYNQHFAGQRLDAKTLGRIARAISTAVGCPVIVHVGHLEDGLGVLGYALPFPEVAPVPVPPRPRTMTCPDCQGRGLVAPSAGACPRCHGTGDAFTA
jgi:hypothetical protein